MGGINARNVLNWLGLLISHYCCIYLVFISFISTMHGQTHIKLTLQCKRFSVQFFSAAPEIVKSRVKLRVKHESFSQGIGNTTLKSSTLLRRPFWIRQSPSPLLLRLLILHLVVFVHLKMGLFFIGKFRVSEWEHKAIWLKENTFKLCNEVCFLQRIFFPSRIFFNAVHFSDDNTTV